jgi:monoterpene epsilon-lactone hydrolase
VCLWCGLPPLLIVVGGAAGVEVTLYIGAGMQHIFPIYCGALPEADAAVAMIGEWIRSRVA